MHPAVDCTYRSPLAAHRAARATALRRPLIALALIATAPLGCGSAPRAGDRDGAAAPGAAGTTAAAPRCRPGEPCWPSDQDWQQLRSRVHGRLEAVPSPLAPCQKTDAGGADCQAALRASRNPFFVQDQLGGSESTGWIDAWTAAPSAYAIVAETADDIAAGVDFAREHRLRLVVKGTGHDYLGRSSAPDSLLIWTHKMRQISLSDAFVPRGCATPPTGVPAVTLEAGTRWLEAYQEVTVRHNRYVQGGGCTSVGAAGGFLQGGGFGSWSRKYGIAAASLLEADVVTADGKLVVANACQHPDLFWALRGGGGGTFGVVTKVTLMTHPLPDYFGHVGGKLTATSDAAFQELLEQFLAFYRDHLNDEHWGETVQVRRDNTIELSLAFEGLRAHDVEQLWQPLRAWIDQRPDRFHIELDAVDLPANQMWNYDFFHKYAAGAVRPDDRPDAPAGRYWWAGDADQVSAYWYAYQSRWIPIDQFAPPRIHQLAAALFAASRHWQVGLHFNKAQAGASDDAVRRGRDTAMNPAVFRAAALAIIGAFGNAAPGVAGHEPDLAEARRSRDGVNAAMQALLPVTPDAGSYVNETDYFEPSWQREFWGDNYPRLLAIKHTYDPTNLFLCHHCVGSEGLVP